MLRRSSSAVRKRVLLRAALLNDDPVDERAASQAVSLLPRLPRRHLYSAASTSFCVITAEVTERAGVNPPTLPLGRYSRDFPFPLPYARVSTAPEVTKKAANAAIASALALSNISTPVFLSIYSACIPNAFYSLSGHLKSHELFSAGLKLALLSKNLRETLGPQELEVPLGDFPVRLRVHPRIRPCISFLVRLIFSFGFVLIVHIARRFVVLRVVVLHFVLDRAKVGDQKTL